MTRSGFALFAMLAISVSAEEPLRGPLPEEQREIIHKLASHHKQLVRSVTLLDNGYEATTTTDNPELADLLRRHVQYMARRLDSGAMVRRWDPAFVELVEYHDQLEIELELLENGIRVVVTSTDPEAIQVARNHARIVTGFTEEGMEAVRREHAPVSPE